jgi:hypothetical protein
LEKRGLFATDAPMREKLSGDRHRRRSSLCGDLRVPLLHSELLMS